MVSSTNHQDIGTVKLNEATFVQLLAAQLEEYVAKCRQLAGSEGLYEEREPNG